MCVCELINWSVVKGRLKTMESMIGRRPGANDPPCRNELIIILHPIGCLKQAGGSLGFKWVCLSS